MPNQDAAPALPDPMTVAQASRAQEATRALAHLTLGRSVPAPEAYQVLGEQALTLVRMSDALRNIGNGVRLSLSTHQVVQDDGSDPTPAAVLAQTVLQQAAEQVAMIADDVWRAQEAIAGQGHAGQRPVTGDGVVF